MTPAQGEEAPLGGGAKRVGDDMVEVGPGRGLAAGGEPAGEVAGADVVIEGGGSPIDAAVVVEQRPGCGVGEQARRDGAGAQCE